MGNFYAPESAMAIVAHPDDIEFSCAGTLARWAKAGSRVCYVLCTSGEVGISERGMTKEEVEHGLLLRLALRQVTAHHGELVQVVEERTAWHAHLTLLTVPRITPPARPTVRASRPPR